MYCRNFYWAEALNIDHVFPLRLGGNSRQENLVASCKPCNFWKADRFTQDDLNLVHALEYALRNDVKLELVWNPRNARKLEHSSTRS